MLRIIALGIIFGFLSCTAPPMQSNRVGSNSIDDTPKKWFEGQTKLYSPSKQNNPDVDFYNFIQGVNTALIFYTNGKPYEEQNEGFQKFSGYLRMYLNSLGFDRVNFTSKDSYFYPPSLCQQARFTFAWEYDANYISSIRFIFIDCKNNGFEFVMPVRISLHISQDQALKKIISSMRRSFNHNITRDTTKTLKLDSELTSWNEKSIQDYLDNTKITRIEGIYEKLTVKKENSSKYKIALIDNKKSIDVIYLDGAVNYKDWTEGERKATINKTASPNFYKVEWLMANKANNSDVYSYIENETGLLWFEFQTKEKSHKESYIKLYPIVEDYSEPYYSSPSTNSGKFKSSGSGFAISKDGVIVTNHHVIDKAQVVKVQITQVGKNKMYDAKVVLSDPKNDLAILKIEDETFTGFDRIPFSIKRRVSDMGTSVYALGYPLIDTMGESIKLTDGLISSKMGFQGDITQYQLSVPVQSGNSGGPLFDKSGNLVGVINAKHRGADNATYAIKSNILANLLELLPNPPSLDNKNTLSNLSLTKQVAVIEDFVFLIKVR